jgi:hypothetical protein
MNAVRVRLVVWMVAAWFASATKPIEQQSGAAAAAAAAADTINISAFSSHTHQEEAARRRTQACGRASDGKVYIGGLFEKNQMDTTRYFEHAAAMLKDRTDGWHDNLITDTLLETKTVDAMCDASVAAPAYYDMKATWGAPLHGIMGCRCSSASMAVARVAGLDKVNMVSMSSTSAKLSDMVEFPFFSRVAAPDNGGGAVGAIVALLRYFQWTSVSLIYTDTQYTRDLHSEFKSLWERDGREISEDQPVKFNSLTDDTVNRESVERALDNVLRTPQFMPRSRIVVLIAHNQHAFPIMKIAKEADYDDGSTVWIATDGWADKNPRPSTGSDWMPAVPGYLGVVPFRNTDQHMTDYMSRLNVYEASKGLSPTTVLPTCKSCVHQLDVARTVSFSRTTNGHC